MTKFMVEKYSILDSILESLNKHIVQYVLVYTCLSQMQSASQHQSI